MEVYISQNEEMPELPPGVATDGAVDDVMLESEVPDLIAELRTFSCSETLAIVGGLLTRPEYQANTLRLEALAKLTQRHSRGQIIPTRNALERWLNYKLGRTKMADLEDPVEEVFVSNVLCKTGDARIFQGLWEGADYHLQCALDALIILAGFPAGQQALAEATALLVLSDIVASRCNLQRNTTGAGQRSAPLKLPDKCDLVSRADCVRFTLEKLDAAGIARASLEPFIHTGVPNQGNGSENSLMRAPLIAEGDELILALPTAVSVAIRARIGTILVKAERGPLYAKIIWNQQISQLVREAMIGLEAHFVDDISPVPLPPDGPAQWQGLFTFDTGKIAHVLLLSESEHEISAGGGTANISPKAAKPLLKQIEETQKMLASRQDYTGGLTLLVRGGLDPRSTMILNEGPAGWSECLFQLHDLLMLARHAESSLLRLWKLKQYRQELSHYDIEFFNPSGDFNLVAWAESQSGRLVPLGTKLQPMMIQIPSDALRKFRYALRQEYDEHAVLLPSEQCWYRVHRLGVGSFFKDASRLPVYTVPMSDGARSFAGLVETSQRSWWLRSPHVHPENPNHCFQQYQLWAGMLSWLARMAPIAELEWTLQLPVIDFLMVFEDWPIFPAKNLEAFPTGPTDVEVTVDPMLGTVQLRVPGGFFRLFAQPENVAERRLIEAMFTAAAELAGRRVPKEKLEELSKKAVRHPHARHFHVLTASDFRIAHPVYSKLRARKVDEGDENRAKLGLGHEVWKAAHGPLIETSALCHKFLRDLTAELWRMIAALLRPLDQVSVVRRALENIEALERDLEHWNISSAAQLALHVDKPEVHRMFVKVESKRAAACLSSRVIAEIALCTCAPSGKKFGDAEFDRLLALVMMLIDAGSLCDAYHYGLAEPPILIEPTGAWACLGDFYSDIVVPFQRETMREHYEWLAEHYVDLFSGGDIASEYPGDYEDFSEAINAELGVPLTRISLFMQWVIKDVSYPIVETSVMQFKLDAVKAGFTMLELEKLLEHLALRHRPSWEAPPIGYVSGDIQPWRFNRRLSLLYRPFVIFGEQTDSRLLFAPAAVRHSLRIRIERSYEGKIPQTFHRSPEMRAWADKVLQREGIAFEKEVAAEFNKLGWEANADIKMPALGASKSLGNLDVLAWKRDERVVATVECKRLLPARTVGEIARRLVAFRGMQKDELGRHLARVMWLDANREELSRFTGIAAKEIKLLPMLVTNAGVPMQFVRNLPLRPERVVSISQLASRLPTLLSNI